MADSVDALPIHCPNCGGALTAQVGPPNGDTTAVDWQCPYCTNWHRHCFGGALHWVVVRYLATEYRDVATRPSW
jgi:hypothetical protein